MMQERHYIRELARQVAEIAASEENRKIEQRWRDVNALRKPDRPPVWCRPVGAWAELLPEDALCCKDPWLRSLEQNFKMILIKRDIGDDSPVDPYLSVHAVLDIDPPNLWGVDIGRILTGQPGGAWAYDPPLKTPEDLARLRIPNFIYNEERTRQSLERTHDHLGDILPVKLVCGPLLGATLCTAAADLRGLLEIMVDMADAPELLHRLMAYLRDCTLRSMRQTAETGLLTPNNTGPMTCSDPVGPQKGVVTYKNLWVMANSQEFDQVSPAMWKEFLLDYQMPIMEQFGFSAYGCCENLTRKIDGVLSIPNLRTFVCSAWTDLAAVIDRVGRNYVIMWRQKASDVVFPEDLSVLARALDEGLRQLQGCYVQVVLRELQALAGHPDRLHVWTRLAIEAAERYS
ncbi:MAG: hypothetical protein IT210_23205 [Armatimonadetes bacterium]|nr:hypothetical protein [Armatimonadota bacterium]